MHLASKIAATALVAYLFIPGAEGTICTSVVDHHTRLLPPAWQFDDIGGTRGSFGTANFWQADDSSYGCQINQNNGYLGWWYAIGHSSHDKPSYNPLALFHPAIRAAYQPRLVGLDMVAKALVSPAGRTDLKLRAELKGFTPAGAEVLRTSYEWTGRTALTNGPFPKKFSWDINPVSLGSIGVIAWVLDNGMAGDRIDIDSVELRVDMPDLPLPREAFLVSLAMLLNNYDAASGMVSDGSYWRKNQMENVTATAKFAKLLGLAMKAGLVDGASATNMITKIADALVHVVPRGPPGVNRVLAHFTANGGTTRCQDTEWASGDTAYAALDLMVALQLIGDPQHQLPDALGILEEIDWNAMLTSSGYFRMGYDHNGQMLRGSWAGFGTETFGVFLAALAGDGILTTNTYVWPPSRNGSGFITHAPYPIMPEGVDRWGNVWIDVRREECDAQIGWYTNSAHLNTNLAQLGLFGLSAAESPECDAYIAYGLGGTVFELEDGGHRVVTPHYAALAAAVRPEACTQMWARLKALRLWSPLNNVESLAVNPTTGVFEAINYLQGSWNLALQAEGWALTDPAMDQAVREAFHAVPVLHDAYTVLMTPREAQVVVAGDPWPHGLPQPAPYGVSTVVWGSVQSNGVSTPADEANGTRYACIGYSASIAGSEYEYESASVSFRAVDRVELTWKWRPEHYVEILSSGGSVCETSGWKREQYRFDLLPSANTGRVFSHWLTNGSPAGGSIPFHLCPMGTVTVEAVFVDPLMDMTAHSQLEFDGWTPNGPADHWLANVRLCASARTLGPPFRLGVEPVSGVYMEEPDGQLPDGRDYVDVSDQALAQLPYIGDLDLELDEGECITATNLAIVRPSETEPMLFAWATWANAPSNTGYVDAKADTDGDGIPNAWEDACFTQSRNNPFDGTKDWDGDGVNSFSEYSADTDPEDPYSYLNLTNWLRSDGAWTVSWAGGVESTQYLEGVQAGATQWVTLFTNTPPTDCNVTCGFDPLTNGWGFFRIRVGR